MFKSFLAAGTLAVVAASAHGEDLVSVTGSFYPQVTQALKTRNIKVFKSLYAARTTPAFRYQEKNGTMYTLPQMVAIVRTDLTMPKTLDVAESVVHAQKDKGDRALVIVWHKIRGTVVGKDKAKHALYIQGTSQDSWRKNGDRWVLEKSAYILHRYTLDGKTFGISKNDR